MPRMRRRVALVMWLATLAVVPARTTVLVPADMPELFDKNHASPFGSEPYAREELVAELGAAVLCGEAGLEPDISNSAAYIDHWRQQLSRDSRLVITAAQQAQRAAEFILGRIARSAEESESHSVEGSPEEEAA